MRRAGLGRFLVEQLLSIGPKWGMKKIMLTVLKSAYADEFVDILLMATL